MTNRVSDLRPFHTDPDLDPELRKQSQIWIQMQIRIQGLIFAVLNKANEMLGNFNKKFFSIIKQFQSCHTKGLCSLKTQIFLYFHFLFDTYS